MVTIIYVLTYEFQLLQSLQALQGVVENVIFVISRISGIDFLVIFLPHVFFQNISTFGHFFTENTSLAV